MAPRTAEGVKRLRNNAAQSIKAHQTWVESNADKSIREVKRRISFLEEKYREFATLEQELHSLDSTQTCDDAIELENTYISLVSQLETLLDELDPPEGERKEGGSEYHSCDEKNYRDVKLPKLDMPEFLGKPEDWPSFYQRFESAVSGLKPLKKYEYLLKCLKNKSDRGIKNLPLLEENYDEAIKKLKRRYDNKMLNLRRYLQELFQLPRVIENDPESLSTLIDTTTANIRAIENQGHRRDRLSNELLAILVMSKLDQRSKELLETNLAKKLESTDASKDDENEEDSFDQLIEFLEERLQVVSAVFTTTQSKGPSAKPAASNNRAKTVLVAETSPSSTSTSAKKCPCCQKDHSLYQCLEFKKLDTAERYSRIREWKLCVNCFGRGHWSKDCKAGGCKQCGRFHHTLLHSSNPSPAAAASSAAATSTTSSSTNDKPNTVLQTQPETPSVTTAVANQPMNGVLLATAQINVKLPLLASSATALLDGGSHVTLITNQLAKRLNLRLERTSVTINGIGAAPSTALAHTLLKIASRDNQFSVTLRALVVQRITDSLPATSFEVPLDWNFIQEYSIADPAFNVSKDIDILIGADILYDILLPDIRRWPKGPTLIASRFGWLVAGPYATSKFQLQPQSLVTTLDASEISAISEFLGFDGEPTNRDTRRADEIACEELFVKTYTRDSNGRFILTLPRRPGITLGESRHLAIAQLRRTRITDQYREFLREYEALGHMERCPPPLPGQETYYLPHHAVYNQGKIRVVFNASAKSSNGVSLNDCTYPGAAIQQKILIVLFQFRLFAVAFIFDLVKMYRQLLRALKDRDLQRIVLEVDGAIVDFQLNTVTYGQNCAPYEALRSLLQLAIDGEAQYPAAAEVIRRHMYMDDGLAGAKNLEEAKKLKNELIALFKTAGMELSPSKCRSNEPALIDVVPDMPQPSLLSFGRALGVGWLTEKDVFTFPALADLKLSSGTLMKRSALSFVSSIFDPLGLISPLTIAGKLLIQKLWLEDADWDEPVSSDFRKEFDSFCKDVPRAASIQFERYLGTGDTTLNQFEIHGFGDASNQAYAACVYIRSVINGKIVTRLALSKTRVAPKAQPRTIPQLELCAAALLVDLLREVTELLHYPMARCYVYTDSTIVLAYLAKEPGHWKPYEGNRVRRITSLIPSHQWRHVTGEINPADLATRDTSFLSFLQNPDLWLYGPPFLSAPDAQLPATVEPEHEIVASAGVSVNVMSASTPPPAAPSLASFNYMFDRNSGFNRLRNAVGYVFRFVNILRARIHRAQVPSGALTLVELNKASNWLVKVAQAASFGSDLDAVRGGVPLQRGSHLTSLQPFLKDNVLRVGGRLCNSSFPYEQKHPVILKATHRLSLLLVREIHRQNFHAGCQFILNRLQSNYWFIGNIRNVIQTCIRTCARCIRFANRKPEVPEMGSLPPNRVNVSFPFAHVGIDYAGPYTIRATTRSVRGRVPTSKGYFAVFVCLATKAVHLEAVSELTTGAFIATLQRFVARRGLPISIISDNGTNFVGADAEMQREMAALSADQMVQSHCARVGFTWKFNPPSAPHMGGLYEAAVKSTKFHLKRAVGDQILTFEEFSTILAQVEAILNSRPLAPLPVLEGDEIDALTPAHFLIGRASFVVPGNFQDTTLTSAQRWRLLNQIRNSFWQRWSDEYLRTLQKRVKWTTPARPYKVNDIVLLADSRTYPLTWPIARITKVYPGADGIVRVVDLLTRNQTILRRPVAKLVRLLEDNDLSTGVDGGGKNVSAPSAHRS